MKTKKSLLSIAFVLSMLLSGCNSNSHSISNKEQGEIQKIYQSYLEDGGSLSYEEWLNTIKGKDGIDGKDGKDGKDGLNGKDGIDGKDGKDGVDGKDGYTPYVENGEWYINGKSTGIQATEGIELRKEGNNIEWKSDSDNEWKTLFSLDVIKGKDGKSAYQIYCELCDYTGTEAEWMEDLISGKLAYKDPGIIDYIPETNIKVTVGEKVPLPTTVLAYYSSGVNSEVNVDWSIDNISTNFLTYKTIVGFVKGFNQQVKCNLRVVNYSLDDSYIDGYVNGIIESDQAKVVVYNDDYYEEIAPDKYGYYKTKKLDYGSYIIKVEANGYEACIPVRKETEKVKEDKSNKYKNIAHQNFTLSGIRNADSYYYSYGMTKDGVMYETSSKKAEVECPDFLLTSKANKANIKSMRAVRKAADPLTQYQFSDVSSAAYLRQKYNVYLANDEVAWSSEIVNRFLTLYSTFPSSLVSNKNSVWKITNSHINNDILMFQKANYTEITVSYDALTNITPRAVTIDGKSGSYFSKRFYQVLVRYLTDNGNDAFACETLLNTNFATSFNVPDYTTLTASTTNEDANAFQEFLPEEKIQILSMFEEMPTGLHQMKELKYLVRRKNGTQDPIYPEAAAVTWTHATEPYIEFMESTFKNVTGYYDTKRLIIHEKMHIFYEYYFSDNLKQAWCDVGGWYKDENDPDGWSTTKTTEFVSAYAHQHNPDEDMAESFATFIINPNLLLSRAPEKYEFIKDYISSGDSYVARVRPDLTFEVYNLNPDYIYPGKIMNIVVKVIGDAYEDKNVQVQMQLNDDGLQSGASSFYFRIKPSEGNTNQHYDFQGSPIDSTGLILRGQNTISKYSKNGYWFTDQITLRDHVGNERYQGINDFKMSIYIDNPLEDIEGSTFDKTTFKMKVTPSPYTTHPNEQILTIEMNVHDNIGVAWGEIRLNVLKSNKYSKDYYLGTIDPTTGYCKTEIVIPEYYSCATYEVESVSLWDKATNYSDFNLNYPEFSSVNRSIDIVTANPDDEAPTLDVNNIKVSAVPSNPSNPNGETYVTITINAEDNYSGLSIGYLKLIDPRGNIHGDWIYFGWPTGSYYGPKEKKDFVIHRTLPVGSAPGTWGIYEISLTDFANNTRVYNFVEYEHFEVNKN